MLPKYSEESWNTRHLQKVEITDAVTIQSLALLLTGVIRTLVARILFKQEPVVLNTKIEKWTTALLPWILIFLALLPQSEGLHTAFPLFQIVYLPTLQTLGVFFLVSGYFIKLWALIQMGRSWRIGVDPLTKDKLVTHGIFSLSRNPIFLGMALSFIGFFLVFPNFITLPLMLLALTLLHLQILSEEAFLKQKYGDAYTSYQRQVPRYFGVL